MANPYTTWFWLWWGLRLAVSCFGLYCTNFRFWALFGFCSLTISHTPGSTCNFELIFYSAKLLDCWTNSSFKSCLKNYLPVSWLDSLDRKRQSNQNMYNNWSNVYLNLLETLVAIWGSISLSYTHHCYYLIIFSEIPCWNVNSGSWTA